VLLRRRTGGMEDHTPSLQGPLTSLLKLLLYKYFSAHTHMLLYTMMQE
jgi:hypothetical protein